MKILFIILFVSVLFVIVVSICFFYFARRVDSKKGVDDLLNFISNHPHMCSVSLIHNKNKVLCFNENKIIPLASTVKVIYAVAFVKAIKENFLFLHEKIERREIDKFYFENTDGNAHKRWITSENIGDVVTLLQVAQGMMQYSSNACTDYLFSRLGADRIQDIVNEYQLNVHSDIYAINSAMLIPSYLKVNEHMDKRQIKKHLSQMESKEFHKLANKIFHNIVNNDGSINTYLKELPTHFDGHIQKELTKKLPSSTTNEYANLMNQLGNSNKLTREEKQLLDKIMGFSKSNEERLWFKGGSTPFVLTSALYKNANAESFSLAVFIEDYSRLEILWIQKIFKKFLTALLEDPSFRKKAIEMLTNTD
ncbi:serine hydrolase [Heyndrickxia sporothermodurans]|uniref:serine hydrolase n=2 Tax=Heyndrickxia sporothermodurans TaxID=46224 RepID=UPI0015E72A0B|nr:serine hydrolase [Heyndrickxia sporothermodurans]